MMRTVNQFRLRVRVRMNDRTGRTKKNAGKSFCWEILIEFHKNFKLQTVSGKRSMVSKFFHYDQTRLKPETSLKVTPFHGCFSRFFKLYKWYQITKSITNKLHQTT